MKRNFDFSNQINEWINDKKLVQIHHSERSEDFDAAYILKFEDNYLTFINVAADGDYSGIIMCHIDDVQLFKTNSIYLQELAKKINKDITHRQALNDIAQIKKFTFIGLLDAFKNTKTIVGLAYSSGEKFSGRVIDLNESTLVLDEYDCECDRCFARTYLSIENITRLYLSLNWLNTISQSLVDKNT